MNCRRWTATALWGVLILALTSIPGSSLPVIHFDAADKLVHATLYAVLGYLAMRAADAARGRSSAVVRVLLGVLVFAAADEWHQQFVAGRSTEAADWLADGLGGAAGLAVAAGTRRREQHP